MLTGQANLLSARKFFKVHSIIPYKGRYKTTKYHNMEGTQISILVKILRQFCPTNSNPATIIHQQEDYKQVISV